MKIRKVRWRSHPILGDLELDFVKADGTAYDSIVLIGENGSGKTSVMKSIVSFLNYDFRAIDFFEYESDGRIYQILCDAKGSVGFRDVSKDKVVDYNLEVAEVSALEPCRFGSVFSKARSDFKTTAITHTGASELDTMKHVDDGEEDYTSLKQMFIDVVADDEHVYCEINKGKAQDQLLTDDIFQLNYSKQNRFVRAFDSFFLDRGLKYGGVENKGGTKEIVFKKGDKRIPIDDLSTGEKQIVFRGLYLLRNLKALAGAIVLVDEPEISMHPCWQKKILLFYEDLFKDGTGASAVQMFFASHSNLVVDSAFEDPNRHLVVMLSSDPAGTISCQQIHNADRVLPRVSSAEINYLAFHLPSVEYHIELYGFLQNKEGLIRRGDPLNVKETDDFIKSHPLYNRADHYKSYVFTKPNGERKSYETLCTYIRNCIDHPNPAIRPAPTEAEMNASIELLRKLCR